MVGLGRFRPLFRKNLKIPREYAVRIGLIPLWDRSKLGENRALSGPQSGLESRIEPSRPVGRGMTGSYREFGKAENKKMRRRMAQWRIVGVLGGVGRTPGYGVHIPGAAQKRRDTRQRRSVRLRIRPLERRSRGDITGHANGLGRLARNVRRGVRDRDLSSTRRAQRFGRTKESPECEG